MIYRPQQVQKMWDTWMYFHAGTYYLYYLVTERSPGEGICLATSSDGVHWQEHGLFFPKADDAQWLGTGSVWQSSSFAEDGHYVMNFSEWRGPSMREGQQTIFFAVSQDLVNWEHLGPDHEFVPDPRWYRVNEDNNSRWDCIYTIPRPGGGRYGYWTANPKEFHPGIGFGETLDGIRWNALPPPLIEWGDIPAMVTMEAGAVEKFGERYYAMLGSYSPYLEHSNGMFLFVADTPQGAFHPASTNYRLLTSPAAHKMTYFARFFPTEESILVNHHAMTRSDERYFAPMKRAVVDADGVMRLGYWNGNDLLKGDRIAIELHQPEPHASSSSWKIAMLSPTFDLATGVFLEGTLAGLSEGSASSGSSFYIEQAAGEGTLIHIRPDGVVTYGVLDKEGNFHADEQIDRDIDRGIKTQYTVSFRLLLRQSLSELYLDDLLIQCYSLPQSWTGRIGLVSSDSSVPSDLSAFRMTLD